MSSSSSFVRLTAVVVTSLLASVVTADSSTTTPLIAKELESFASEPAPYVNTVCPRVNERNSNFWNEKYHNDDTCHRASYDTFVYEKQIQRHKQHRLVQRTTGNIEHVPNEETLICPLQVRQQGPTVQYNNAAANAAVLRKLGNVGFDTAWIVENGASTPIVLSWMDTDGKEVSYSNPDIYPAVADPEAIIDPGQWVAVNTMEGHIFTARAVLDEQLGLVGPVLLQHRAGLIPVGKAGSIFQCPAEDIEPRDPETNEIDFEYSRTRSEPQLPCNTINLGFRNNVNCPLHAYFVTGKVDDLRNTKSSSKSCSEQFKFHLGTQSSNLDDYLWDWTSTTKYEQTYMGHSFRFRLAANPDVIVDTITLQPTIVRDCPMASTAAVVGVDISGNTIYPGVAQYSNATTSVVGLGQQQQVTSNGTVFARSKPPSKIDSGFSFNTSGVFKVAASSLQQQGPIRSAMKAF